MLRDSWERFCFQKVSERCRDVTDGKDAMRHRRRVLVAIFKSAFAIDFDFFTIFSSICTRSSCLSF